MLAILAFSIIGLLAGNCFADSGINGAGMVNAGVTVGPNGGVAETVGPSGDNSVGAGNGATPACLVVGRTCNNSLQCCDLTTICYLNHCGPCHTAGQHCSADTDCCGTSTCNNGYCTGNGTNGCLLDNDPCYATSQCCGTSVCFKGFCGACLTDNRLCINDGQCCGGSVCSNQTHLCTTPLTNLIGSILTGDASNIADDCSPLGGTCANNGACCDQTICVNGMCAASLPAGQCATIGSACLSSLQCCGAGNCVNYACTAPRANATQTAPGAAPGAPSTSG